MHYRICACDNLSFAPDTDFFPLCAVQYQMTVFIQTLGWPLSTHALWLESFMFSRIPLGVRKTLLHGGGVTSSGTYGHQSGQGVIPPTSPGADPLCWKGSRWPHRFLLLHSTDTIFLETGCSTKISLCGLFATTEQEWCFSDFGHNSVKLQGDIFCDYWIYVS